MLPIRKLLDIAPDINLLRSLGHTSDVLDLGNTVGVTEDNTNLGGGSTLLGELADLLDNLLSWNGVSIMRISPLRRRYSRVVLSQEGAERE